MGASPSEHVFLVGLLLSSEDMQKLPAPFCWKNLRRCDKKDSVLQWKVTVFTETRKRHNVPKPLLALVRIPVVGSPDCRMSDHRRLGLPSQEGFEPTITSFASWVNVALPEVGGWTW